jgi:2-(1,2-epoxy-1,2-dihydrophenyl)acetyl-CoA isomerase
MSKMLLEERYGAIAFVTFNRPEWRNALNRMVAQDLRHALHRLEFDETVRCVVLRGAGGNFTSGTDLLEMHLTVREMDPTSRRVFCLGLADDTHASIRAIRRMAKPVIASLTGAVAGFGFSLALAADFAVAAENTSFVFAYGALGASPDGGLSLALTRLIGERRALGLAFTGEPIIAATALDWGLVNQVVPANRLDAHVRALAERLVTGPTQAYARTKALIRAVVGAEFDSQLEREAQDFAACATTEDFEEGIAAFLAKRAPRFQGR